MNQAANANLFSRLFDGLDDPKRLAVETQDGGRISYGDLIARAGQMANVLVARGVKPGDRVAVQVEKSVANIVLYLATVRAGAGDEIAVADAGAIGGFDREPARIVEAVEQARKQVGVGCLVHARFPRPQD